MLIYSGQKIKEKHLGYFADFCPICRSLQAHRNTKRSVVSHVYLLSFGEGETLDFIGTCLSCGIESGIDPLVYEKMVAEYHNDLSSLIDETYPSILDDYHDRLELEKAVEINSEGIEKAVRKKLIREVFEVISPYFEREYSGETKFDKKSGTGCFMTFLLFFGGIITIGQFNNNADAQRVFAVSLGILLLLIGSVTFYLLATTNSRFIAHKIFPLILRSLLPLKPKKEELDETLFNLKSLGVLIGKKIKLKRLLKEIMKERKGLK